MLDRLAHQLPGKLVAWWKVHQPDVTVVQHEMEPALAQPYSSQYDGFSLQPVEYIDAGVPAPTVEGRQEGLPFLVTLQGPQLYVHVELRRVRWTFKSQG